MVYTVINMQPKQSVWSALGQGLGNAMQMKAAEMMQDKAMDKQEARDMRKLDLQARLSDMYEQKKTARKQEAEGKQGLAILKILKPDASEQEMAAAYAMGGQNTFKLLENLGAQGFADFAASGGQTQSMPQAASQQKIQGQDVLGRPPSQNINIQGLPDRQPQASAQQMQQPEIPQKQQFVEPSQPRPPFMAMQSEAPSAQVQQEQGPKFPQAAVRRAADMSDQEFKQWLDSKRISPQWQVKYQQERRKQQEMDLKQREDVRRERKDLREEVKFQRETSDVVPALKPYVADIALTREKNRKSDQSLKFAEMAIDSGDASGIFQYAASVKGIEPLKSMDTALLDAAAKEFLTSSVGTFGSKANMWLEKQVRGQYPTVGGTKEANKARLEVLKTEHDINKKKVELFDRLSDEDKQKYGSVQTDIQRRVDDKLKDYANYRMNLAAVNIQELRDAKKTQKELYSEKVAKGTPLTQSRVNALWSRFHDKEKIKQYIEKAGFQKYDTRPVE